ncbi:MAG: aminotransferase class I/II-fold pyridoxal phosphate-dependent enzyme [Firmicutes bacterium]|nr:aminotransferase class I/II-fold pyridoxal phosphate-dependent enzyme [Bacillota bacterium]
MGEGDTLAQVAGIAGMNDREYMEETNRQVKREKQFLFESLSDLNGIKPLPGAANFLLVEVTGTGYSSGQLTDRLGSRGILVRDCEGFCGLEGRYLRLAVKTRPENEKLIKALEQVLGG